MPVRGVVLACAQLLAQKLLGEFRGCKEADQEALEMTSKVWKAWIEYFGPDTGVAKRVTKG